jgi:integrase
MATRRTYGTGSLVERPEGSGKWSYRFVVGTDPVTGKVRRRTTTITAKSKTAAQAEARKILADVAANSTAMGTSATVEQLLQEWMNFQSNRGRSPTTLNGYKSVIEYHIVPSLGTIKIADLTAHHLDSVYGKCTKAGTSPGTVRNIHRVITAALNQGVRWGWLDKNPALHATLPEATPRRIESPTPEQARALITACQERSEVLGAFVFLAAVTGCRRGEIAALRWSAYENGTLIIGQSAYSVKGDAGIKATKTGRVRVVHLDPVVQTWLANWHQRSVIQAKEWDVVMEPDGFIISSRPDGSRFVNLDLMSREVRRAADRLGMKSIHLHSLRHFAATELLAAGISARDAAEMLGRADASLTLRVYAHATADRQKAAARVLAGIVQGPETLELT